MMRRFLPLLVLLTFVSCGHEEPQQDLDPGTQERIPESRGAYRHVVILGVDGAGAFFQQADTPQTDRIFADGTSTCRSLAVNPTISAQNWGSMLHGVLPEFHRLTNSIVVARPYPEDSPFPSIFRVVRETWQDAQLASFCNWNAINVGIVESNLDVVEGSGNDMEVARKILAYLDVKVPTLLFAQFDSVDGAGHNYGFGSSEHLTTLSTVDALIGQIYAKLEIKGLLDDTLFIVCTDHGGTPAGSHGGTTDSERFVFLGVAGKTVDTETGIGEADNRDIAAIAAYALGLDFPETWTARVPTGIFKGVEAEERKVAEIPVNENRKHQTVPTPDLSKVQELLRGHEVIAYLPLDGDRQNAFGSVKTAEAGKLYYYDAYFGKGASFDDGYVTLKDVSVGTGSFSAAFWMKTDGVPSGADPAILSNKDWKSGLNDGFVLSLRPDDIKFNAGSKSLNERMDLVAQLPYDYKEGWMHVVLVVDRKENEVLLYEDFNLEMTMSIPAALQDVSFDAFSLNIGQDGLGTYGNKLPAQLDEFIIMADAMTTEDVAALKAFYR